MNTRRRARAFSLIELAVYAALLVLLLGGVYLVVSNGARYLQLGAAFQNAQSESLVGMRKLVEELSISTDQGRVMAAPIDSDYVIFLSPQPDPSHPEAPSWTYKDGVDLEYYRWVCYSWDQAEQALVRAELPVNPSPLLGVTTDPPPLAPTLATFQAADGRVVARGVNDLRISVDTTPDRLEIRLSTTVDTASDKQTTVTTRSIAKMPNP